MKGIEEIKAIIRRQLSFSIYEQKRLPVKISINEIIRRSGIKNTKPEGVMTAKRTNASYNLKSLVDPDMDPG